MNFLRLPLQKARRFYVYPEVALLSPMRGVSHLLRSVETRALESQDLTPGRLCRYMLHETRQLLLFVDDEQMMDVLCGAPSYVELTAQRAVAPGLDASGTPHNR